MLAPWRSLLASAIHRNRSKPYSRYFQLATVTPEGYPSNRTVVFRGFLDDEHNSIKIITDLRSAKIKEIEHQAIGEICWYFTKTREQFRLYGTLRLVTASDTDLDLQKARKTTWHDLSDAARSQFIEVDSMPEIADHSALEVKLADPHIPLDNFCLLLLLPQKIDHLQLRLDPQQTSVYTLEADSTWSTKLNRV